MDTRPVVWDQANRRHIGLDHPERAIEIEEVEEALRDPDRQEVSTDREDHFLVVGRTLRGRILVIVWVSDPRGRYPVHARQAARAEARRYYAE
jgi:uncharacterized DUF497 family protein